MDSSIQELKEESVINSYEQKESQVQLLITRKKVSYNFSLIERESVITSHE